MFTRQIPQNLKSATVKVTYTRKIHLIFESVIPTEGLASKSLLSVDTQRPLLVNCGKIIDPKIGGIEVGNIRKLGAGKGT